jgi:uncharacterized protein (TIGR00297 family)
MLRAAAGVLAAALMALLARRLGALRADGALAATLVGGLSAAAGWRWALLLVAWFVASSALTRVGRRHKEARTAASLAPSSARDARQVVANGGVFALAALGYALTGEAWLGFAAIGALAAAAADTWATEIGLLWGGVPRSILTGRRMDAGLSGGVTWAGSLGGVAGAVAVGAAAPWVLPAESAPIALLAAAGVGGGLADSVLGAAVQAQRWCARCQRWTERDPHDCGARTERRRGWRWMTNDTVNLLTTLVGAGAAVALAASRP